MIRWTQTMTWRNGDQHIVVQTVEPITEIITYNGCNGCNPVKRLKLLFQPPIAGPFFPFSVINQCIGLQQSECWGTRKVLVIWDSNTMVVLRDLLPCQDKQTQITQVRKIVDVRRLVISLHWLMAMISLRLIGEPSNKMWWLYHRLNWSWYQLVRQCKMQFIFVKCSRTCHDALTSRWVGVFFFPFFEGGVGFLLSFFIIWAIVFLLSPSFLVTYIAIIFF